MKLQLICLIFGLLSVTTRSICAFTIQEEVKKDLAGSEMLKAENGTAETSGMQTEVKKDHVSWEMRNAENGTAETSGMQHALLQRSKRSWDCTFCCFRRGCGICCRRF